MAAESREIPLFPLAHVVLFPRARVPLFIFEPRYREMVRDALAGAGHIGMVCVRPEGVAEMSGDPPIFEVGCEGRISSSRQNPDGTYHITLDGVGRFRVECEPPREDERLYRVARVVALEDGLEACDRERAARLSAEVVEKLRALVQRTATDRSETLADDLFGDADAITIANSLSQALAFGPLEKQSLLEADGIAARLERLLDLLNFHLLEAQTRGTSGDGVVH